MNGLLYGAVSCVGFASNGNSLRKRRDQPLKPSVRREVKISKRFTAIGQRNLVILAENSADADLYFAQGMGKPLHALERFDNTTVKDPVGRDNRCPVQWVAAIPCCNNAIRATDNWDKRQEIP